MIKKITLTFGLTLSCLAASSGSLLLSSRIGVNIDYRIDENNNVRIISNAPFKKQILPYQLKSKNSSASMLGNEYKVLEIAAN